MKRVLILSDSLALARTKPEICLYEDTYPAFLKKGFEVHQVSIGGATSADLLKQVHYHKSFNPDVVILQVGIVDCAPRFISRKELDFTYAIGAIGKGLRYMLNKKWIKQIRKISYINKAEFKENLNKIQDALKLYTKALEMIVSVKETKANPYFVLREEDKKGYLVKSKEYNATRRQDLPKVWELNGAIYIINKDSLFQQPLNKFKKVKKYIMDDVSSHDIDTEWDWKLAEMIING